MAHIVQASLALERLKRTIKHRQILRLQAAFYHRARLRSWNVFNRVMLVNVPQDFFDLCPPIAKLTQGWPDSLIDNLEHPATSQQLIFYQRDIRLDPGGVAILHNA